MKSQGRAPSHGFTGKSEQNITTIKPFSLESRREDSVTSSCCSWRNAFWLIAMHFGKKWWIREFVLPFITLLKSWLCCCPLATLAPQQKGIANSRIHHFLSELLAFNQSALRHFLPECIAPRTTRGCHTNRLFAWIPVRNFALIYL